MVKENKTINIALAVVLNEDGDVLIVKRKFPEESSSGAKLKWAFPGGKVENNDSPEETAIQEALEETGHYIEAVSKISQRKHPQFEVNIQYFECGLTTDATTQLIDDHEIVQIAWVNPKDLQEDYFETDLDPKVAKFLKVKIKK